MRNLLFLLLIYYTFSSCRKVISVPSQQKNVNIIGSPGNAVVYKIILLPDDGYALTGYVTNSNGKEILVSRFSKEGKILWSQTYGDIKDEEGRSIIALKDGGFMIGGYTTSFNNEAVIACLFRIDKDGHLLWKRNYEHKASTGITLNFDPLLLDYIHPCKDGTYNLYEYNCGNFRFVGGLYSEIRGQYRMHIDKIDANGNSIKDTLYDIHIPGHSAARKSDLFGFPEQETGTMKILEISLETGNFTQPSYYLWHGEINESSLNYSRLDSISTISGYPFTLTNNVWSYLFGLNSALSANGGMIISFVEAEKSYLVITDAAGKNVTVKTFPGFIQAMNVSPNGNIALAGASAENGSIQLLLLDQSGKLLWSKDLKCKTQFIGSDFFGSAAYWGSPCSLIFNKEGHIILAFTKESPEGGKTDIAIIHLNDKGEILP
jgi:hypothetical protein